MIKLALENEPATDSCSERHSDDVATPDRGATPEFPKSRAVGVVVESRFELDALRDLIPQRKILPAEIRRHDHDAILAIERPRRSDADAEKVRSLRTGFGHRLRDDLFDHSGDPL